MICTVYQPFSFSACKKFLLGIRVTGRALIHRNVGNKSKLHRDGLSLQGQRMYRTIKADSSLRTVLVSLNALPYVFAFLVAYGFSYSLL